MEGKVAGRDGLLYYRGRAAAGLVQERPPARVAGWHFGGVWMGRVAVLRRRLVGASGKLPGSVRVCEVLAGC